MNFFRQFRLPVTPEATLITRTRRFPITCKKYVWRYLQYMARNLVLWFGLSKKSYLRDPLSYSTCRSWIISRTSIFSSAIFFLFFPVWNFLEVEKPARRSANQRSPIPTRLLIRWLFTAKSTLEKIIGITDEKDKFDLRKIKMAASAKWPQIVEALTLLGEGDNFKNLSQSQSVRDTGMILSIKYNILLS